MLEPRVPVAVSTHSSDKKMNGMLNFPVQSPASPMVYIYMIIPKHLAYLE